MKAIKKITGVAVVAGALTAGAAIPANANGVLNALGSLAVTVSSSYGAYSCDDANYGTGGADDSYNASYNACKLSGDITSNKAGSVVTAQASVRALTRLTTDTVSGRIQNINRAGGIANLNAKGGKFAGDMQSGFNGHAGLAAGDMGGKLGVWTTGTWKSLEDENAASAFDGNALAILVGADYQVTDQIIAGLAISYDELDIDTKFNGSITTGEDGSVEANGWGVVPYASFKIDDIFSAELTGGVTWADYDTSRFLLDGTTKVTGETDAMRYFVKVGLNADRQYKMYTANPDDYWTAHADINYLYAREEQDSFTESNGTVVADNNTNLSQLIANTTLGYRYQMIEPYAKVGIEYDLAKTDTVVAAGQAQALDDDFGVLLGGGVRADFADNVSGSLEGTTLEGKDDYNEYTVTGNVRVTF